MAERKRRGKGADGEPAGSKDRDNLDEAVVDDDPAGGTLADSEGADVEDTKAGSVQGKSSRRRAATAVRGGKKKDASATDDDDAEDSTDVEDSTADDDDAVDDEAANDEATAGKKSGTAKKSADGKGAKAKDGKAKDGKAKKKAKADTKARGLGRIPRFIREVVAELRKVIWPTRKELVTYAIVVIVFVAVILALVAGLDYGFSKGALWVFGGGTSK